MSRLVFLWPAGLVMGIALAIMFYSLCRRNACNPGYMWAGRLSLGIAALCGFSLFGLWYANAGIGGGNITSSALVTIGLAILVATEAAAIICLLWSWRRNGNGK